jgi:hypothetical protein
MAIAIGYEKDIILSSILKTKNLDKVVYDFDFEDIVKTNYLKKERLWEMVASETEKLY